MTMHRHLDDELAILRDMLLDMASLVDEQLAEAINAVSTCDKELAERVRSRDDEVDAFELKVDSQCERILALFTPVAMDLRLIITAVKINTDLERIGDHAKNLAKHTKSLQGRKDLVARTQLNELADEARALLHRAQDAFIRRDRVLAREVLATDRQIDRRYKETQELIAELLREEPQQAEVMLHLATMAKAIERIADHTKNIAERVVFLVEGIDIRHRRLQQSES